MIRHATRRSRVTKKLLTASLGIVTAACGGGPAASSPVPTPTPAPAGGFVIYSAETREPVAATVTAGRGEEGPLSGASLPLNGGRLKGAGAPSPPPAVFS